MVLARTFTVLAVGAMLGLAVSPAGADQRRGRGGDQGDRDGQRRAGPVDPYPPYPDAGRADGRRDRFRGAGPMWPRGARPFYPDWGPIVSLPGVGGRNRGWEPGPVFHGARGWYPYRSYGPRVRFANPYYAFRPRVSAGIGLWVGFPVPFPAYGYGYPNPYGAYSYGPSYGPSYGYPAPYPYPVPYPVPYPAPNYPAQIPQGSVSVAPAPMGYGGVSFEITPSDAEVWVDGGYAGRADEFDPGGPPLSLTPGPHRIELRAPGHRPLAFDVTVTAGQVIPYQGALQPGL